MTDDAREQVVRIEVVDGPAGPSLGIMDGSTGQRIAGPKPWGGGDVIYSFRVPVSRILDALRDSEGREVVAEGFVRPSELPESVSGYVVLSVYSRDHEGDRIPVALVRRQEDESGTGRGGKG